MPKYNNDSIKRKSSYIRYSTTLEWTGWFRVFKIRRLTSYMSFNINIDRINYVGGPLNSNVHFEIRGESALIYVEYRSSAFAYGHDQVYKYRVVSDNNNFYIDAFLGTPNGTEYIKDSQNIINLNLYNFFVNENADRILTKTIFETIETVDYLTPSSISIIPDTPPEGQTVIASCNLVNEFEIYNAIFNHNISNGFSRLIGSDSTINPPFTTSKLNIFNMSTSSHYYSFKYTTHHTGTYENNSMFIITRYWYFIVDIYLTNGIISSYKVTTLSKAINVDPQYESAEDFYTFNKTNEYLEIIFNPWEYNHIIINGHSSYTIDAAYYNDAS